MAKPDKNLALAGLSGLIAALAYSYSPVGLLVFIAHVPLLWALSSATKMRLSGYKAFQLGFFAGLVYFLLSFRWFLSLHPLDGLGITNRFVSIFCVAAIWFFVSIILAGFWGLLGLLTVKLKNRLQNKFLCIQILFIPSLFVALELFRANVFGLITYGPGSLLGSHWTFGNLGYALSGNNLFLALSSFLGIYSVLFLVVLTNVLIFEFYSRKNIKYSLLVVSLIIAAVAVGQSWQRPARGDSALKLAILQTDQNHSLGDSSANNLAAFKKEFELLNLAIKETPDSEVLIFPEGSNFFKNLSSFLTPLQVKNYFTSLAKEPKLIVDNSRVLSASKNVYSRVLFLNSKQDIVGFYDKKLLTPGGEYLPGFIKLITGLVAPKNTETFESLFAFSAGHDQKLARFNDVSFRAMACSDFLSPGMFRTQSRDADIIIGLASTAIFHDSRALIRQNLAINKFRAAENNTPMVLAANSGLSYVLDNAGNTIKIAHDSGPQILTVEVVLGAQKSWYNKVGDRPMFLMSSLILLAALIASMKSPKQWQEK